MSSAVHASSASLTVGQNMTLNGTFKPADSTNTSFGEEVLFLPPLHLATVVISAVLLILAVLLGTAGNTLVLISFVRNRALRTATNAMVVNLSAADLLACTAAVPLGLAVVLASTASTPLPSQLCHIQTFFSTLCNLVTLLMLVGISVDRWLNITYPFTSCDSKTIRVGVCICFSWIAGLTVAIAEAVLPTTSHFHERCLGRGLGRQADAIPLQTYSVVPVGLVALFVVTVCYALIVRAVRIHMKRRLTRLRPRRPVIFVQAAPENTALDNKSLPNDCSVVIVPATPSIFSPSAISGHSEAFTFASPASSPGPGFSSGTSSQITLQTPIASPCNSRLSSPVPPSPMTTLPSPIPPSPMASYYSSSTCTPNTTSSPCMPDTDIEELTEDSTPQQAPSRQHFLFDHENIMAHQHVRPVHGHEQRHPGKFLAIPEDQEGDRPETPTHGHEFHTFGNFLSVPTPTVFRERDKKSPHSATEGYELENMSESPSPTVVSKTQTDIPKSPRRSSMSALHCHRSFFKRRVSWTHADSYDLSQEGNAPVPGINHTCHPVVEHPADQVSRRKLSWTLPDLTKRFRVRPNSNSDEEKGKSSDDDNATVPKTTVSRIDLHTETVRYYRDDDTSLPDVTCPPSLDSNGQKSITPVTDRPATGAASSTSRDGKTSSGGNRRRRTRLADRSPSQRIPDAMDKSAAIRSVYIILAFIVAWIPLPVAMLIEYLVDSPVVYNFETIAYVLMLSTRVVHPLLYACFHKGFRTEFRRSLRGLKCKRETT
ncbi:uncharacterized protein [Branchiostoma lanceolatum]|uniref:uncharacterized protein n=1 Tax=Branchiostoma lanceolatum TaxID=7740 RepID=UPI003455E985